MKKNEHLIWKPLKIAVVIGFYACVISIWLAITLTLIRSLLTW